MGTSVGIVGLPNVGKSTLFNALTAAGAESANYPFCTIDPNIGVVAVPDPRLHAITEFVPPERVIPAAVDIVDIAGLVKGASKGEGLGNKFLANIRETDAVMMVVRCFEDPNVVHVDGSVDPLRDIEVIELELIYADLETTEKRLKKAQSAAKSGKAEAKAELAVVEKVLGALAEGKPARTVEVSGPDQEAALDGMQLLTSKPVLYCCNVGEEDLPDGNASVQVVRDKAASEGAEVVVVCGKIEEELAAVEGDDMAELLELYGLSEPALHKLVRGCYRLLGLQSYFTAGEKEVRAWTIRVGDTAPQAAGVIHTDFERGFIRAQVYHTLDDLRAHKSEAGEGGGQDAERGQGLRRQDGDIMHFLFNV
ncbi:MAG: redox-regulated ATPase YchF [Sandaracinaceae bacterium]